MQLEFVDASFGLDLKPNPPRNNLGDFFAKIEDCMDVEKKPSLELKDVGFLSITQIITTSVRLVALHNHLKELIRKHSDYPLSKSRKRKTESDAYTGSQKWH